MSDGTLCYISQQQSNNVVNCRQVQSSVVTHGLYVLITQEIMQNNYWSLSSTSDSAIHEHNFRKLFTLQLAHVRCSKAYRNQYRRWKRGEGMQKITIIFCHLDEM